MDIDEPIDRTLFKFDVPRYWSGPRMIPGRMIIANVLFNPSDHDMGLIIDFFGRKVVVARFKRLLSDPAFRPSARKICIRNLFDSEDYAFGIETVSDGSDDPLGCDLKHWVLLRVLDKGHREYIQGEVIQDRRGRYKPGEYIYSSEINKKVGDWIGWDQPDVGRHVQTNGGGRYYPHGTGQILDVPSEVAEKIRSGVSVNEVMTATVSTKDVIAEIENQRNNPTEELWKTHSVLYGVDPKYPGKIVAYFRDGTQKIGEWRDGKFVLDSTIERDG